MKNNITWIPTKLIHILNHRHRDPRKFNELVNNISLVGLKKPITVTARNKPTKSGKAYNLVCGQGRLEAFEALELKEIAVRILDLSTSEALLYSLIENIARRNPGIKEEMRHILSLKKKKYNMDQIGQKVGLSASQVRRYCALSKNGETRLLHAVLNGKINTEVATIIAGASNSKVRNLLQDAYESGKIGKNEIKIAREIADDRMTKGKALGTAGSKRKTNLSEAELVRSVKKNVEKKQSVVKKSRNCENKLLFIETTLKRLLQIPRFLEILKAENLDEIPSSLAERLQM